MNILGYEIEYDEHRNTVVVDMGFGDKGLLIRIGDYAKMRKNNGRVTYAEVYDADITLKNISSYFSPFPVINYVLTQFVDKGGLNIEEERTGTEGD